jgi:hypothetical protein
MDSSKTTMNGNATTNAANAAVAKKELPEPEKRHEEQKGRFKVRNVSHPVPHTNF